MTKIILTATAGLLFFQLSHAALADDTVLTATESFAVMSQDIDHYLGYLGDQAGKDPSEIGTARVSQAIIELYALETLNGDAIDSGVLTEEAYTQWLSEYLIKLDRVRAYVDELVARQVTEHNFSSQAREYYQAHSEEFQTSEVLTVRSFLVSTEERSLIDAIDLARRALPQPLPPKEFERVIMDVTDDKKSKRKKGVMTLKKGETVPPFEAAAFALERPGDTSDLVITKFGVHVIQLISREPPEPIPFGAVRDQIEARLKAEYEQGLRQSIIGEARQREPEGFMIDAEAIDSYMLSRGYEPPKINLD